jgi:hypothetical protein
MSSSIRRELEGFVAGSVKAERLVIAVATAYYGDGGRGKRDGLGPLIEVIDRASPGIVELGIVSGGAGFEIRLAERPFPKEHEGELRRAAETVLRGTHDVGAQHAAPLLKSPAPLSDRPPSSGLIARVVSAVRRLFGRASG